MAVPSSTTLTNCLFFATEAEEAANFYVSIFPNSAIKDVSRFTKAGRDVHKQAAGSVMAVSFTLDGHPFTALNSRPPHIKFSEGISLQIGCDTQDEVDYYWDRLTPGGDEAKQVCGWLADKYGVSWQVVPSPFVDIMRTAEPAKKEKVMAVFMKMKKIVIQDLVDVVEGTGEGVKET